MGKLLLLKERNKLIQINQIRISSFHLNQMHFQIPNWKYMQMMYHVDMDLQLVLWMKIAFFTYVQEVLTIQVPKKY